MVNSTAHCNTFNKFNAWYHKSTKSFSWLCIELQSNHIQVLQTVAASVGSFREVRIIRAFHESYDQHAITHCQHCDVCERDGYIWGNGQDLLNFLAVARLVFRQGLTLTRVQRDVPSRAPCRIHSSFHLPHPSRTEKDNAVLVRLSQFALQAPFFYRSSFKCSCAAFWHSPQYYVTQLGAQAP